MHTHAERREFIDDGIYELLSNNPTPELVAAAKVIFELLQIAGESKDDEREAIADWLYKAGEYDFIAENAPWTSAAAAIKNGQITDAGRGCGEGGGGGW